VGFELTGSDKSFVTVSINANLLNDKSDKFEEKITKKYALIRRMEFNSERKRMSILVRDPDDGLIKLYCKGADSVILERLDSKLTDPDLQHETENFLQKASTNGLRTLCLGMRILNETELNEFL
jgi:P-type E1-E2 ATPase